MEFSFRDLMWKRWLCCALVFQRVIGKSRGKYRRWRSNRNEGFYWLLSLFRQVVSILSALRCLMHKGMALKIWRDTWADRQLRQNLLWIHISTKPMRSIFFRISSHCVLIDWMQVAAICLPSSHSNRGSFRVFQKFQLYSHLFCLRILSRERKRLLQLIEIDQSFCAQFVSFSCRDGNKHRPSLGSSRHVTLTKKGPFKRIACKSRRFVASEAFSTAIYRSLCIFSSGLCLILVFLMPQTLVKKRSTFFFFAIPFYQIIAAG